MKAWTTFLVGEDPNPLGIMYLFESHNLILNHFPTNWAQMCYLIKTLSLKHTNASFTNLKSADKEMSIKVMSTRFTIYAKKPSNVCCRYQAALLWRPDGSYDKPTKM